MLPEFYVARIFNLALEDSREHHPRLLVMFEDMQCYPLFPIFGLK